MQYRLALSLIVAGLGVIAYALYGFYLMSSTTAWTEVQGKIVSVDTKHMPPLKSTGANTYKPVVLYQYEFKGKVYTGNVVRFGSHIASKAEADATISRFIKGESVPVYVNPDNPSLAILEPNEAFSGSYATLGIGVMIAIIGFFLGFIKYGAEN